MGSSMANVNQRNLAMPAKKTIKKTTLKGGSLFFKNHQKAINDAWNQLKQTPISTFVTCTVLAMTLFLTTTLFAALETFKQVAQSLHASNQVTVYLKPTSKEHDIHRWVAQLKQNEILAQVTYISPDQALRELMQQADFKDVLSQNEDNPLPPVLLLKFANQEQQQMQDFVNTIKNNSLVTSVNLNFEWFERLFALLTLGNRLTYLLTIIFSIGVLFIVSHTIQGATAKNHKEMTLLRLIGASQAYVRRPFLYLGLLLGVGAGIIAIILMWCLFLALQQPLDALLQSYNLASISLFIGFKSSIAVIACSSFLGWLGSVIAFYQYDKARNSPRHPVNSGSK